MFFFTLARFFSFFLLRLLFVGVGIFCDPSWCLKDAARGIFHARPATSSFLACLRFGPQTGKYRRHPR
jgi:hypothetical protein